ncbi:DNA-binding NarL/FixJ family response regulator [Kribbella amoyensis]|uniref:DNA-binding NarL/FixJ family response regulator n=1 Tax=Kribbella amoyensis TaxID=996641 RepID=A0A561BRK6_9ACTN|nr:response regulator transcription factor [Kribbella amoyensis]TWD81515.1 DNA-binding NarL/FixJ family response regulator [Kribbella amoyensis]
MRPTGCVTVTAPTGPAGVLVVVADPVVRAGIRALVGEHARTEVAGTADSVRTAAAAIRRDHPDLVLVDSVLVDSAPGGSIGELVTVCAEGAAVGERPRVVALVTGEAPSLARVRGYFAAGVDGIVSTAEDIGDSLLAVRSGRAAGGWISPTLAAEILRRTEPPPKPAVAEVAVALSNVTPSEHAVLRLVADGNTDREIATRLHRSERVVKFHVSNLLAKLQARNRAHLVQLAVRSGLLPVHCPCGQAAGVRSTRDVAS